MDGDDARPLRILSEYLQQLSEFRDLGIHDTIAFFGSALPKEQRPNPFISPDLNFMFRYFFMRKLWFAHLAKAIVIFPGGFGTLDELFEILTLASTRKFGRPMPVLLYGTAYWNEIINFEALVRHGMISPEDAALIRFADNPAWALRVLQEVLPLEMESVSPGFMEPEEIDPT